MLTEKGTMLDSIRKLFGLSEDSFWTYVILGAFILLAFQIFVDALRPRRQRA